MGKQAFHTRFAPSPTGNLHMGHAYSALFAYQKAMESGGTFQLRIEDIDHQRCSKESEEGIFDDLAWLGLKWPKPVPRQSERMDVYKNKLQYLDDIGVIYPCFCSRKDIREAVDNDLNAPHSPEGPVYPGTCRHLSKKEQQQKIDEGRPYSLRLDVEKACRHAGHDRQPLHWFDYGVNREMIAQPELLGDIVLARKDISTSYHLSVVVDDAEQGINLVTRGEELFIFSHIQVLLFKLLEFDIPQYWHHKMLVDDNGERIAKRDNPLTLKNMRESGVLAEHVCEKCGYDLSSRVIPNRR